MSHTQIGPEDWHCIARMLRAGHSLSEIARTIGKDVSSVSRHVAEHGGRDGYDVREVRRRKRMKRLAAMDSTRRIRGPLLRFIVKELKAHKSPEQIAGVLTLKRRPIAPSTIYRYINERAPHLKHYLRSQKGKYRRLPDENKTIVFGFVNQLIADNTHFMGGHILPLLKTEALIQEQIQQSINKLEGLLENYEGFYGVDFILTRTKKVYVLEANVRMTAMTIPVLIANDLNKYLTFVEDVSITNVRSDDILITKDLVRKTADVLRV